MNRQIFVVALLTLALGAAGGYRFARMDTSHDIAASQPLPPATRQPLFYRHPMKPEITSPVPVKDNMNMDYIPVYADDAPGPAGTVKIDPVTVQNIGVRTARAERRTMGNTIRAVGRVDYNEERLARLNPKTEGWVDKLMVSTTGERVRRGTVLLSLYSPQLVTAQQEYLLALQNRAALKDSASPELQRNAQQLVDAARGRLELLDMPEHQILKLERSKEVMKNLHIHSPFDGVVVSIGARPGQFVTPGTELYQIANLDRLWVYVDIYENELPWVRVGDSAEMRVNAAPGRVFEGKVTYLYPMLDAKTRTARLRLEFSNSDRLLKPEMFAEVTVRGGRTLNAIAIPSEAVVRSGIREQVYIVRTPGKFEPREVQPGVSADGWTEIRAGVSVDDVVVTSAQFLIDSESKLREAVGKMREPAPVAAPAAALDMSDMDMGNAGVAGGQPSP